MYIYKFSNPCLSSERSFSIQKRQKGTTSSVPTTSTIAVPMAVVPNQSPSQLPTFKTSVLPVGSSAPPPPGTTTAPNQQVSADASTDSTSTAPTKSTSYSLPLTGAPNRTPTQLLAVATTSFPIGSVSSPIMKAAPNQFQSETPTDATRSTAPTTSTTSLPVTGASYQSQTLLLLTTVLPTEVPVSSTAAPVQM